jgi:hypothetical protein
MLLLLGAYYLKEVNVFAGVALRLQGDIRII